MEDKNLDIINSYLKTWELLWNHYKLEVDLMEKRRNLYWIIQSALFISFYSIFIKNMENDTYELFLTYTKIIPIFGMIISASMFFVMSRHRKSILLNQQGLREIEERLNIFIFFNRFVNDKRYFNNNDDIIWPTTLEKLNKQRCLYIFKIKYWFDYLIPLVLIFIWLFIIVWFNPLILRVIGNMLSYNADMAFNI